MRKSPLLYDPAKPRKFDKYPEPEPAMSIMEWMAAKYGVNPEAAERMRAKKNSSKYTASGALRSDQNKESKGKLPADWESRLLPGESIMAGQARLLNAQKSKFFKGYSHLPGEEDKIHQTTLGGAGASNYASFLDQKEDTSYNTVNKKMIRSPLFALAPQLPNVAGGLAGNPENLQPEGVQQAVGTNTPSVVNPGVQEETEVAPKDKPYGTSSNYNESTGLIEGLASNRRSGRTGKTNRNIRTTTQTNVYGNEVKNYGVGEYQDRYSEDKSGRERNWIMSTMGLDAQEYSDATNKGMTEFGDTDAMSGMYGDFEARQRSVMGNVPGAFQGAGQEFNDDRQDQFNNVLFNPNASSDRGLNEMYNNFYNTQGIV